MLFLGLVSSFLFLKKLRFRSIANDIILQGCAVAHEKVLYKAAVQSDKTVCLLNKKQNSTRWVKVARMCLSKIVLI